MSLFETKGDAIHVAGKRVPLSALAVGATLLVGFLVLRARNSSSNVVSAGSTAAAAAAALPAGYNATGSVVGGVQDSIAQLSNTVNQLAAQQAANQAASTAGSSSITPSGSTSTSTQSPSTITPVFGPVTATEIVQRDYETYLGRQAEASGLQYWAGYQASHGVDATAAGIAGSAEGQAYRQTHNPPSGSQPSLSGAA